MYNKNQKTTPKTIKTLLFVGIIAAMILPFSSMDIAEASSPSLESQIAKIDQETAIMEMQQENEESREIQLHHYISDKKILLENLRQQLAKAQNNNNDQEIRSLLSEISLTEKTIQEKESIHLKSLIAIEQYDEKLVGKWNKKAEIVNFDFEQKKDNLRKTSTEFATAEQTIKTIFESESISNTQWNSLFDSLDVMLEKLGENQLGIQYREELKDTILAERYHQSIISETSSYLESNFPQIHFIRASNSSCGTPSDYMPYHYQPKSDIKAGNGLVKTYAKMFDGSIHGQTLSGKCIIEVTHVYHDEDKPIVDGAYDVLRGIWFGRGNTDIETYFIVVDKSKGTIDRLSFQKIDTKYDEPWPLSGSVDQPFGGTYAGTAIWNAEKHLVKKVTNFSLESQQHPKIYVNTWNHVYGESDNNPSMMDKKTRTTSYSIGDRIKAENDYSSKNYTSEILKSKP